MADLATRCPRLAKAHHDRQRELAAMRRFGVTNPRLALQLEATHGAIARLGCALAQTTAATHGLAAAIRTRSREERGNG